jgi:hypothetical protein
MGTEQEAKLFRFHSHNIHYIVVLVKEVKHLASTQTMGSGVSLDQATPGPTGIGCPRGGGSYRSF